MGYDVERFVGGVKENDFLCQICASVLQDPVETPCEHFFCSACISKWLSVKGMSCPFDQQPLMTTDLKQPSRLLRNLLAKLEIKCDFEENGCNIVVKLENLANHRSTCSYNPDTEITCNKECSLQIRRRDQASDCFEHIKKKMHSQHVELSQLAEALQDQRSETDELKGEMDKLKDTVVLQQEEIERLELDKLDTLSLYSKVRFLFNADRDTVWQTFENMKMNHNRGILENDDKSEAGVAQLSHQLEPLHPSFGLCVVNTGPLIGMGLAGRTDSVGPNIEKSVVYVSDGTVLLNGKVIRTGEKWKDGDYISCDINDSIIIRGFVNGKVSFNRNFKEVFSISSVDLTVLFPTVWVG